MADVFVSYSRKDQAFVRDLVGALAEHDKDAWVDWEAIAPTAEFLEEIRSGIEGSDAFVFVISPDAADSAVCREEVEHAEHLSKRVLPVLRRDVDAARLPPAVALRQWIFSRERDDFRQAVDELVRALDTDPDWVRGHTELLEKALEWERHRRDRSFLLRGTGLRAAETWLGQPGAAEKEPPPAALHSEYVLASARAAARRQRGVVTGVTAALVVAIALAVVALVQRSAAISQRQTAVSQLVASEALRRMDTRLDEALLLSVAGYRVKDTPEARHALLVGVHRSQSVLALVRPPAGPVSGAILSPDGRVLAVAAGREVTLWSVDARRRRAVLPAGAAVTSLSFSSDGRMLAATAGGKMKLWRLGEAGASATTVPRVPSVERVEALSFSPDADLLAIGTGEGRLLLWQPGTRRTREFTTGAPVTTLAFNLDGTSLAAGGPLGAFLVDPAAGGDANPLEPVLVDFVAAVAFASRRELAVVTEDGRLVVLDATGRSLCTPTGLPALGEVAPDRRGGLVAGADDGQVLLLRRPCERVTGRLTGHEEIRSLDVSRDGARLASTSVDGLVVVWTTRRLPLVGRVTTGFELVADAAFGWQAGTVAVGGEGGVVLTGPGRTRRKLEAGPSSVLGIDAAPGARVLAAAGDGRSAVWIGARYAPVRLASATSEGRTVSVAVDRAGALVAEGTERGTVMVRRVDDRAARVRMLRTGGKAPVIALAFAERGGHLAAASSDGRVVIWDLAESGEKVIVRQSGASVSSVAFDPARDRLALGDDDGAVTLWDVDRAARVTRLSGHQAGVTDVAFAPDGRTLVSSDSAGRIMVWDSESLRPLGEPLATEDGSSVEALDFDARGRRLAAAGKAGTMLVLGDVFWEPEQAVARVCEIAARGLGEAEWGEIVPGDPRPSTCGA